MIRRNILAIAAVLAVSGCVSPLVRPNPLTLQNKATATVDWKALAHRTVLAIPVPANGQRLSVYVAPGPEGAEFSTVYRRFLEEELFNQNYPVQTSAESADVILDFHSTWLLYAHNGKRLTDYATLLGAATAVGGQLRDVSSLDTGLGLGVVGGIVFDFLASLNGTTNAEVVLTSTLTSPRSNHYHFVRSETVYVRPSDLTFYIQPVSLPVVPLRVSSGYQ